jgi:acyl carrier protein
MDDPARAAVRSEVLAALAATLKLDPSRFDGDESLADAGVDSLGLVEAVFVIEERFDISIPFNANEQGSAAAAVQSVGQLLDQVVDLVMAKRCPVPA